MYGSNYRKLVIFLFEEDTGTTNIHPQDNLLSNDVDIRYHFRSCPNKLNTYKAHGNNYHANYHYYAVQDDFEVIQGESEKWIKLLTCSTMRL